MYTFSIFINLILVTLTTTFDQNSSFPYNVANWSIDCERKNIVGPNIMFTGALRFQYGPSTEEFVDMPNSHDLVNVSTICEKEVQFLELHWMTENSTGIENQWMG